MLRMIGEFLQLATAVQQLQCSALTEAACDVAKVSATADRNR